MPGFIVEGDRIELQHNDSNKEYFYSYTWNISKIFNTNNPKDLTDIKIGLKDCTLPTFTVNKETIEGAQLEYKFAKSISWEDVNVTWYDSEGLFQHILSWRKSVWDSQGIGLKTATEYKKNTVIESYAGSWNDTFEYQKYELYNSWPSSIKYGDLTYTSSEVKYISVTITYDWAVESIGTRNTSTPA